MGFGGGLKIYLFFTINPPTNKSFLFRLRYLIGFKNLIRSIENIGESLEWNLHTFARFFSFVLKSGVSAVYGINYYGRGYLSREKYINYIKYDVLGKDLLNSTLNYVPSLKLLYRNLTNFTEYGSIKNMLVPIRIPFKFKEAWLFFNCESCCQ